MKGHWIPPSPKGFIDRIAAKLGYSKTIPSGLGTDLVDAVGTLSDQKANKSELTDVVRTGTTNSGTAIVVGTFFYLNDVLVRAKTGIANGAQFTSSNYEIVTTGALNSLLYRPIYNTLTAVHSQNYTDSDSFTITADGWYKIANQINGNTGGKILKIFINGVLLIDERALDILYYKITMFVWANKDDVVTVSYGDTTTQCQSNIFIVQ